MILGWIVILSSIPTTNHYYQSSNFGGSGSGSALLSVVQADICFMLYQMADNNLEEAIRADNNELIQSSFIQDETVTTWIYFDARNYNTPDLPDVTEPLMNIYNADGTAVTGEKYQGSQYFTYDHSMQKMIIHTTLEGEQNGDDPETVYAFVTTALTDCIAQGSTEFFMGFSSHGSGVGGFGGDENIARRWLLETEKKNGKGPQQQRQRSLLGGIQSNNVLAGALSRALQDVEGAPALYDMIGFDACLMSSFEALDDYQNITKYYLASEVVEPAHGTSYATILLFFFIFPIIIFFGLGLIGSHAAVHFGNVFLSLSRCRHHTQRLGLCGTYATTLTSRFGETDY
jgi:Clostripain family